MLQEEQQTKPNIFQEIMGNRISKLVLWGTIGIGITGILFALIALGADSEKVKTAFSILQYVFGALLPLWGTWIGTVLAYYYSKENFKAASDSVRQMVDKLTSEKKLESVKAKDVMIAKDKLIYQTMATGEDLSKFKLKEDCIDFVTAKGIKRVIILDEKGCAKYAIHRDLISYFITNQIMNNSIPTPEPAAVPPVAEAPSPQDATDDANNNADGASAPANAVPTPSQPAPTIAGFTLKDMYEKGTKDIKDTMDNSVKFISEEANLLEAKGLMEKYRTCQDVFVTKTGDAKDPVLGWITNVTISQNSVV